MLEEADTDLLG